jgi:peptide/nickel transport system substrate-binding protein
VSGIGPGIILDPRYYLPVTSEARYGAAWVKWFDPGNEGLGTEPEAPPEVVQQQMELYRQIQRTADQQQQANLMTQILAIAVDQFYAIGISTPPLGYGVVKDNFHNVPETVVNGHVAPHPSIYNTCQFFIED